MTYDLIIRGGTGGDTVPGRATVELMASAGGGPGDLTKALRYGELDREVVVAAAVRVAELGGVHSVTVRALATEPGLSTTAMYRYVDGKAELLNLIAEATLAAVELPATGSWQDRVRV
jgi:AcrR family transcriptional regulator